MTGVFFIIGGQRCGSTSLARILSAAPNTTVRGTAPPEPRFFLGRGSPEQALAAVRGSVGDHPPKWVGEKSTTYLERPDVALRIRSVAPGAPIFAILRNPVIRALSNYSFSCRNGAEELPIAEALTGEAENRPYDPTRFSTSPYHYLRRGHYAALLRPWLQAFDHLEILILEDVIAGRQSMSGVWRALGHPEPIPRRASWPRSNAGPGSGARTDPALLTRLRQHYRAPNRELEELLGRRIASWSLQS